ncbi:hypothetical protein OS121_22350 [Mycolicibacterium mucogenicum]|uniref:hypothetical protein n=1 Tax=Mycolicibacterium mucogenicum TaxID=56689 RepID=UPI00226A700F|nr:hypothetical protein [Mycolicibacterium mucogenicum]MCX8557797.1 hypothetical protein [Mycolicibacterium mucogenicum]
MSEVQTGAIAQHDADDAQGDGHRRRTVINWVLAGLTVPGALAIILYQYAQVLATAGCSERTCAKLGPSPFVFGLIEYGAPVVAVLAVALSFVTAKTRRGIVVPLVAWALLIAGFAVLTFSFETP